MQKTNPQTIEKILKKFFKVNPQIEDKLAEARLIEYWNKIDPLIGYCTCNAFVKNRVFYAKLKSSVLKNELMMQREKKVAELNQAAGKNIIDRIVFN